MTAPSFRARWVPALLALLSCATPPLAAQGRVIVIGVDGLDHAVCIEMMAAGHLPALARLAATGSFIPLIPTNPPQSPVSWATITTGRNPGSTGVFDFIRREFRDGGPTANLSLKRLGPARLRNAPLLAAAAVLLAMLLASAVLWILRRRRAAAWVLAAGAAAAAVAWAVTPGEVVLTEIEVPHAPVRGDAIWSRADRAGVPSVSILAPLAFPAPHLDHGCILSGLGVPDAMGTPGTVTLNLEEHVPFDRRITQTGCRLQPVSADKGGVLRPISVPGPPARDGTRRLAPVEATIDRKRNTIAIEVGGEREVTAEGRWSRYFDVPFDVEGPWDLHALARFRVLGAGDRAALYQEPACFDPRRQHPLLRVTTPASFGAELWETGPFDTLGWACATNPFQDEIVDEATFLADIAEVDLQREGLVRAALHRAGWRLFFCVISTPDRVQHMFWRDRDPEHPRHDAGAIARRGDPILAAYRRIDGLIAHVQEAVMREGDLVLVISDHGFAEFRFSVNLNRFLAEAGFLSGTGDGAIRTIEGSLDGPALFPGVDWSRTQAYSLGLGKIYLNLEGREPHGVVPARRRREVLEDIRRRLLDLRHEGRPVVRSVASSEEIYRGAAMDEAPDLVVGFERGYRVSWQSTLGSLDEPAIAPNRNLWSGDHCTTDPTLVPGVLFSSRRIAASEASVTQIHATIEAALGLAAAEGQDGSALPFAAR